MTEKNEHEVLKKARACTDETEKHSLVKSAEMIRSFRLDLERRFSNACNRALFDSDIPFFNSVAEILSEHFHRGRSAMFDHVRFKLVNKYYNLLTCLRRPPTPSELKDATNAHGGADATFENMNDRQFRGMYGPEDMNLTCTPENLIKGLDEIAKRRRSQPWTVRDIRFCLVKTKTAADIAPLTDSEYLCFCERTGIRFDPNQSLRAHHECLCPDIQKRPFLTALWNELPGYVKAELKMKTESDLEVVCERESLAIAGLLYDI